MVNYCVGRGLLSLLTAPRRGTGAASAADGDATSGTNSPTQHAERDPGGRPPTGGALLHELPSMGLDDDEDDDERQAATRRPKSASPTCQPPHTAESSNDSISHSIGHSFGHSMAGATDSATASSASSVASLELN